MGATPIARFFIRTRSRCKQHATQTSRSGAGLGWRRRSRRAHPMTSLLAAASWQFRPRWCAPVRRLAHQAQIVVRLQRDPEQRRRSKWICGSVAMSALIARRPARISLIRLGGMPIDSARSSTDRPWRSDTRPSALRQDARGFALSCFNFTDLPLRGERRIACRACTRSPLSVHSVRQRTDSGTSSLP